MATFVEKETRGVKAFVELAAGEPINEYTDAGAAKKQRFHRLGRSVLKALAEKLGLFPGTFDIRSNPAGIAGCGAVTLHGDWLYVDFGQTALGPDWGFMFRRCRGRKDSCGGRNEWMRWETLLDLDQAAKLIRQAVDKAVRIHPGEEGVAFMPHSEVMIHMGLAGKWCRFELSADGQSCRVFTADGKREICAPVSACEAGVMTDMAGYYYRPHCC